MRFRIGFVLIINYLTFFISNHEILEKSRTNLSTCYFLLSLKTSEVPSRTSSVAIWFAAVYPCVSPEDPEGQKCIFLFLYQINIEFIKIFRVFRDITDIHTIKPKHG